MGQTNGTTGSSKGFRFLNPFLAVLLGIGLLLPQGATAKEAKEEGATRDLNIHFFGLVAGLPDAGLTVPPSSTVTIQIVLLAERGHTPASLSVDITPETKGSLEDGLIQNGQLVKVQLSLRSGRLVVKRIKEAGIGFFVGTLSDVPGGTLTLPVSTDQTVTVLVGNLSDIPLSFVITPTTDLEVEGRQTEGLSRPAGETSSPKRPVGRPSGQPSRPSKPEGDMATDRGAELSVLGNLTQTQPQMSETASGRTLKNGDQVVVEVTVLGSQLVATEIRVVFRGQAPSSQVQIPNLSPGASQMKP